MQLHHLTNFEIHYMVKMKLNLMVVIQEIIYSKWRMEHM